MRRGTFGAGFFLSVAWALALIACMLAVVGWSLASAGAWVASGVVLLVAWSAIRTACDWHYSDGVKWRPQTWMMVDGESLEIETKPVELTVQRQIEGAEMMTDRNRAGILIVAAWALAGLSCTLAGGAWAGVEDGVTIGVWSWFASGVGLAAAWSLVDPERRAMLYGRPAGRDRK